MSDAPKKVLLITHSDSDSGLVRQMLEGLKDTRVRTILHEQAGASIPTQGEGSPHVVFLDLSEMTGDPEQKFLRFSGAFPALPFIVILGAEAPTLAAQLVAEGAQDCLFKNDLNGSVLQQAMMYAIARQSAVEGLRFLAFKDELTGLYNRRGFLALTEHEIKIANRTGQTLLVALIDLRDLRTIDRVSGYLRSDEALLETTYIMKEVFRDTDLMGRLDRGKFGALLSCRKAMDPKVLAQRLAKDLEEHNSRDHRNFLVSLSIETHFYNPLNPCSPEELIQKVEAHRDKDISQGLPV